MEYILEIDYEHKFVINTLEQILWWRRCSYIASKKFVDCLRCLAKEQSIPYRLDINGKYLSLTADNIFFYIKITPNKRKVWKTINDVGSNNIYLGKYIDYTDGCLSILLFNGNSLNFDTYASQEIIGHMQIIINEIETAYIIDGDELYPGITSDFDILTIDKIYNANKRRRNSARITIDDKIKNRISSINLAQLFPEYTRDFFTITELCAFNKYISVTIIYHGKQYDLSLKITPTTNDLWEKIGRCEKISKAKRVLGKTVIYKNGILTDFICIDLSMTGDDLVNFANLINDVIRIFYQ
jgi:hypothetical protein